MQNPRPSVSAVPALRALCVALTGFLTSPVWAQDWFTVLEREPNAQVVTDASLRQRITNSGWPWRVRDNQTGIEMVLVPQGSFTMGAASTDTEASSIELPTHTVQLSSAFYLSRTEVTQAQWTAAMGSNPSLFTSRSDAPVERVGLPNAQAFCSVTGLRLPTEAEWEFACRAGGTGSRYGAIDSIAWYSVNAGATTRQVATKAANGFGLYDMLGNVGEWCADRYGAYTSASVIDPTGASSGSTWVVRGGAWNAAAADSRCSARRAVTVQDVGAGAVGFRVARTAAPAMPRDSVVMWGDTREELVGLAPLGSGSPVAVAAGDFHVLVLLDGGFVLQWGQFAGLAVPADIQGRVVGVAAGGGFSVAVLRDRTVRSWGTNWAGQTATPAGLLSVSTVAAGGYHALALKSDGTVVGWGMNQYGQASNGAAVRNAVQIECGYYHSLATLADGTMKQWGDSIGGPSAPWPSLTGVVKVSGGGYHSMALRSNGSVACWGANGAGQAVVPSTVVGAVDISAGYYHSAALLKSGRVVCWGSVVEGQSPAPTSLSGVTSLVSGAYFTLAVKPFNDCDENGREDFLDIRRFEAADRDADGRLDACEYASGDLDLNGWIDLGDVALLLLMMGESNPPFGDLDLDGSISLGDLAVLLTNFGPAP